MLVMLFFWIVIYLQDIETRKLHFVCAKNRIINSQLKLKSIPSLELNSVTLAVEALIDLYKELSGSSCLIPIHIDRLAVFTDSTCSLHWLNSSAIKLDKRQKHFNFCFEQDQSHSEILWNSSYKFQFYSRQIQSSWLYYTLSFI